MTQKKTYFLILGASGLTGTEVVKMMTCSAPNTRVTYREQAELNVLRNYGAEPFFADFGNEKSIEAAMADIDRVLMILPIHPDFGKWGKNVIDIAKEKKVEHLVTLSNLVTPKSPGALIGKMHSDIETYLQKSGLSYTIVRSAPYYQNLFWSTITILRQKRFDLPLENSKIPHIDVRDVAQTLTNVLINNDKHSKQVYTITGPIALSMFQMARILSECVGYTIRYFPTPKQSAFRAFRDMGQTEWISRAVTEMYEEYVEHDFSKVSSDFQRITGKRPRSFEHFAEEYKSIFYSPPPAPSD